MKSTENALKRRLHISEKIRNSGEVTVQALSELFKVTPATIRSDLRDLESRGNIRRTLGGAESVSLQKKMFVTRNDISNEVLFDMTLLVTKVIEGSRNIFICHSSINSRLVAMIDPVTVELIATTSLQSATNARELTNARIILAGGELDSRKAFLSSSIPKDMSDQIFDSCLIPVHKLEEGNAVSLINPDELNFYHEIMKRSREVIGVWDTPRYEDTGIHSGFQLSDLNYLVAPSFGLRLKSSMEKAGFRISGRRKESILYSRLSQTERTTCPQ